MDERSILLFGSLTIALIVSVYLLWGPTPKKKKSEYFDSWSFIKGSLRMKDQMAHLMSQ